MKKALPAMAGPSLYLNIVCICRQAQFDLKSLAFQPLDQQRLPEKALLRCFIVL
jgi:hypothetical protein